jgi:hypothetical protein
MNNPKPSTFRSPNLSTNFPATKPVEKRTIAKTEIINPMAVLLTPKEAANTGTTGIINPKPTATKKETDARTATSLGSSVNGLLKRFFLTI